MRLSTVLPIVLAFSVAAGAAYLGAKSAVRALEAASATSVDLRLQVEGFDWADVQADGLQVVLSGEAPTEAARFQAMSSAGSVVDAARVIDNMDVREVETLAPPTFALEILRNDAGISLIGLIPASTNRDDILRRVRRVSGDGPVTDLLESADHTPPEAWALSLEYALDALEDLPRSKISVGAERVEITAAAEGQQARDRLEVALSRAAPDGVTTALRISAPRPVITPFTLRFTLGPDGADFDACSSETAEDLTKILTAATEAGFEGKSDCRLGLGSPSTEWGDAASAGIKALAGLGSGSITFADTSVSLVGVPGTDQALFDRVSARLEGTLPEVFTLTAVLPAQEVETEDGPAGFLATRSPEGQVQMRGHVGDDLARAALASYAQSRFGADATYLAVEDHGALPQGWPLRVLAGLAALSEVSYGSVEVTAETVTLRGESGNQDARARIAQVLNSELGDPSFSVSVRYNEALDPTANIPTPEECLSEVVDITTQKKLTFEPGSADLDAVSLDTLAAVADVLKECPEFEIVVEGHTDSQGRESMNLALSQDRAEAVVEALRGKRLAWAGLFPQGFGEDQPIADNDTEEGREANRRIEFRMVSADDAAPEALIPEIPEVAPESEAEDE